MLEILMLATHLPPWGPGPAPEPPGWWEGLLEGLNTDLALALFTGGLVLFSGLLWWSTKSANRVGQLTTRMVERAYLSVEPQGINTIETSESGEQTFAYICIRNTGRLPARDVFLSSDIDASHGGDRDDFPPSSEEHGSYIVPSGTVMTHGTAKIPATSIDKVQGKDLYCYVWGTVRYNDGFDKPRHTTFCHRYPINVVTGGKIKKKYARFHNYGNDAN